MQAIDPKSDVSNNNANKKHALSLATTPTVHNTMKCTPNKRSKKAFMATRDEGCVRSSLRRAYDNKTTNEKVTVTTDGIM
jgi:hypothetical protein